MDTGRGTQVDPGTRSGPAAWGGVDDQGGEPRLTRVATRFSADGDSWWNGSEWLPAVSESGFWRWDGTGWQPQVSADLDAARLVDELERLSAGRHIRRGEMLVFPPEKIEISGANLDAQIELKLTHRGARVRGRIVTRS